MYSSRRSGRATRLITLVVVAMLATACGGHSPSSQPPNQTSSSIPPRQFPNWPPEANEFRFHWAGAPGVDLANGPAVALRAYVESYRLTAFAGGDQSAVYPGFMRATAESTGPSDDPGSLLQLWYVRPKTRADNEANGVKYVPRQIYGYQPTYVLDLTRQESGYRATVCLGLYSVYRTADDDRTKYFSTITNPTTGQPLHGDGGGIEIWRVELTDTGPQANTAPPMPALPQIGPQPAPVDDVFGPWFITGNSSGVWGPVGGNTEQIDTPEARQQCAAAMPDDAAARTAMSTGFHTAPPPHGDAIPGWPAESK